MSSNRIPGRCFVKLSDVTHFVGRMIDIYGVVVESSIPRASLGTDYVTTLKIIDPSQQNPEIGVNFFAESVDQLPRVRSHKDLLFLLSVKIENKRDVLTAVYQKKWTSFALLDGRDVNDFSPYQSCRFYMLSSDRAYIRQLRSWGQSFAFDAGRSDYVRLLKDLNPASSFVDLVCQVLYICQTPNEGWTLYVWDGTDAPSLKFNTILLDEERRPPPLQIEQTPLPNHVLCSFPLVGTVLRVSVDRSYISVGDYFEGIGLRSWVRIRNLLVSTYAGLWKGKIGPSTKIRPLSNADNSVVERLRCWEARTTLGRMPSASILLSNTITVTSHENVEPVSLMDIRAFSHTISQDSGRFRCIVRVISICPSQVKDFRSPREQVYRIRMTLEDPTARIEAILTGGDGEMFFKGYSSMESISSKMKSLLGMDCEGGERNPPWTPFCVDLRNHPIPGECVLGVHFHVTDTWLVYGNPQVPPLEVLDWE